MNVDEKKGTPDSPQATEPSPVEVPPELSVSPAVESVFDEDPPQKSPDVSYSRCKEWNNNYDLCFLTYF